ncbi:MAG: delta-60 repeat domain-containing protein [Burkholderiales bacterium]
MTTPKFFPCVVRTAVHLLLAAVLLCASIASAQRVLTVPDVTGFEGRGRRGLVISSMTALPDGGYIVAGHFGVWYEGKYFTDLLRLKPNGDPDTSWNPSLSYLNSYEAKPITNVVPTPGGVFIAGDFQATNGVPSQGAAAIDWTGSKSLNWELYDPPSAIRGVSHYDPIGDWVYYNQARRGDLRRSGTTGAFDASWPKSGACLNFITTDDTSGGVSEGKVLYESPTTFWLRVRGWSVDANQETTPGASLEKCTISATAAMVSRAGIFGSPGTRDWQVGVPFAILGNLLYFERSRYRLPGLELDAGWQGAVGGMRVTPRYYYAVARRLIPTDPLRLTRYSVDNGSPDSSWTYVAPGSIALYDLRAETMWWQPAGATADDAGVLTQESNRPSSEGLKLRGFMVKDDGKVEPEVQVVEYYAPALKRYFITGRAGEQTALDGLPQSFQRTGMKFTAKSSKYRDIAEQPVCRMYASPEKGMSNSHFYGIGSDCATLNKLSGLKYEGYDFSILKPTAEQACPAEASKPVTRLFNNKVASNESNHRYVVSAATKAKMLSQGWVDEGVVFCSSAVTDAVN